MARIGVKGFRYAKLTAESASGNVYSGAQQPGYAISCEIDWNQDEAKLAADDMYVESEISQGTGSIKLGIDNDDPTVTADILGHEITSGEVVYNDEDQAPYVGIGRVVTKVVHGVYKYAAKIITKTKFKNPKESDKTKEPGKTEFGTLELEGSIFTPVNGNYKMEKEFDDFDDAIGYIEDFFAAPATPSTPASP